MHKRAHGIDSRNSGASSRDKFLNFHLFPRSLSPSHARRGIIAFYLALFIFIPHFCSTSSTCVCARCNARNSGSHGKHEMSDSRIKNKSVGLSSRFTSPFPITVRKKKRNALNNKRGARMHQCRNT